MIFSWEKGGGGCCLKTLLHFEVYVASVIDE
jgi:hypothetical protein